MQVVQESPFSGESANSDDSFQQFTKVGKDGGTGVRFHSAKVTTGVEISNCKLSVCQSNEGGWNKEPREDDAIELSTLCKGKWALGRTKQ